MAKQCAGIADPRPDWDTYFMEIAQVTATRANCSRRKVAAVVVSEKRIISTGYNGTPRGVTNCFAGGCPRCAGEAPSGTGLDECICVHAEQNAICQAAKNGVAIQGATVYCRMTPCRTCAMLIINCGIIRVVCEKKYHDATESEAMFRQAGIGLEYVSQDIQEYDHQ